MVYVHLCHLFTHFCNRLPVSRSPVLRGHPEAIKRTGGIGVAFLFLPLDLDSGMAWNGMEWLCLKIWGGDETYIFRPQTQFVSMSIKSRCYGSATKRSEVLEWPDFTVYLVCPESWTKTTLTVRRCSDKGMFYFLKKRQILYSHVQPIVRARKKLLNPLPLRQPQLASSQEDCLFVQPVISSKVIEGYCGSLDHCGVSWGLSFSCSFHFKRKAAVAPSSVT